MPKKTKAQKTQQPNKDTGKTEVVNQAEPKTIETILLKGGYVTPEDIKSAKEYAERGGVPLEEILLNQGLITKDLFGQAMAEYFGVTYADLNSRQLSEEQILKIPESLAVKYKIALFSESESGVIVTSSDPSQKGLATDLKQLFKNKKVELAYSLPDDLEDIFLHYRKPLKTRFAEILKKEEGVAPEILNEIFDDAIAYRASDVHFEPQDKEVIVRFRIDDVLHDAGRIPRTNYVNILNRIKVMARMKIDEHFVPQDGAIRYNFGTRHADFRVSIVPTVDGEKIVVRLLSEYVKSFNLAELGLDKEEQEMILAEAAKPFGMIVVSGPTGSGKTTTLYSLIKILNSPEVNITTIEDPVEFKIIGANQIQVNHQTDLTFARGLRSIVRQDPDIILVGEIRDKETAEISVNAALTGHMLFSTFHANDAATSIPRLLNMGAEPFLLASTLNLLIAQRLVRQLCPSCRYSTQVKREELEKILPAAKKYFPEETVGIYKAKGCSICGGTGFRGRVGIFEIIRVGQEMRELILKNPTADQIWAQAKKQGSRSLFESGIEKIKTGQTTLEELMRVARP